jgi:CBS domain-containing protein
MIKKPQTVKPDQKIEEAMKIMDIEKLGSLPVVQNQKLIGMLTETEFFHLSRRLFERF